MTTATTTTSSTSGSKRLALVADLDALNLKGVALKVHQSWAQFYVGTGTLGEDTTSKRRLIARLKRTMGVITSHVEMLAQLRDINAGLNLTKREMDDHPGLFAWRDVLVARMIATPAATEHDVDAKHQFLKDADRALTWVWLDAAQSRALAVGIAADAEDMKAYREV
ncbi:MAG TPA: hypothetical protein VEL07_13820 [Planctomycetota bacterium]|nr:hypothetical protein [Planctomycetota bacterium]